MLTYAAMREVSKATSVLRRPVRRSAAMRPISVLDVRHPLERDAQVAGARAFDGPRPTSTSSADLSPVAVDPDELLGVPGDVLSPSLREPFEERMGRSFSRVRVHVGAEAGSLAERLHARAFTHGRDIYFARGEFRPETREGRGLLAHELAHTLQPQVVGGTPVIARFAAPGAASSAISEEAKEWLDARSCVEPTSPQGLALLVAFHSLPVAVQAEIVAHFKVDTTASSARLRQDLKMSTQHVIGQDGLGGTITGTQQFVEGVQHFNQTARGTAAVAANVLGAVGLGMGMVAFDDKERQLALGEFGAGLGNILLTGPGINRELGKSGSKVGDTPSAPPTIAVNGYFASSAPLARSMPPQPKPSAPPTIPLNGHFASVAPLARTGAPQPKPTAPVPAGLKPGFDDSGVLVRSKSATAPQTNANTAQVKKKINARLARGAQEALRQEFEAARARDGIARLPSKTDREIMTLARESHWADKKMLAVLAKEGTKLAFSENNVLNYNLTTATLEVMAKRLPGRDVKHYKSDIIGYVGERPVYGSEKHGVGVVRYGDTWFVVQMKDPSVPHARGATLVEIFGRFD